jgi:hypothetical protein
MAQLNSPRHVRCVLLCVVVDRSLAGYCPSAVRELTIPRYFTPDALQLITDTTNGGRRGSEEADEEPEGSSTDETISDYRLDYRDDWPSLFIGAEGTRSGVHVDPFA